MTTVPGDEWEEHARWWRANFAEGRDPEYAEQILPLVQDILRPAPGMRILDAGCGEGQVARMLFASGARVVGCDPSAAQLEGAEGTGPEFLRARLEALPFVEGTFDAVVVVLVLEHVAMLDAAVSELSRVVRPGGRVLLVLNHPLFQTPDSGWVDDQILGESYWRVGDYLQESATLEEVDRGVHLTFHHRPLERYVSALVRAGLVVDVVREPRPPPGFLALAPAYARSAAIPRVLVLGARRLGTEK